MSGEIEYTTDPLECLVRVHHDTNGELTLVEVSVNGNEPVKLYPEPGDSVGDMFEEAYEASKVMMLTRRVVVPKRDEPTVKR